MTYLFKEESGFVFGDTPQSECPSGLYRIEPNPALTHVTIRYAVDDRIRIREQPIAEFCNAAGEPYASYAALQAGAQGFFDEVNTGIVGGEYVATAFKSDTVDLPKPGWIEAMTAGTVKYTPANGDAPIDRTVEAGWLSVGRVRRLWLAGTAIVNVHY